MLLLVELKNKKIPYIQLKCGDYFNVKKENGL
jgi:hypothetical protein